MFWLFLLISFIIIISIVSILFVVYKQKREFNYILNENIIEDALIRETKSYTTDIISEKRFKKMLDESLDNPDNIELLRKDIQNRLRLFMKVSDIAKARQCNEQLKQIDTAMKQRGE